MLHSMRRAANFRRDSCRFQNGKLDCWVAPAWNAMLYGAPSAGSSSGWKNSRLSRTLMELTAVTDALRNCARTCTCQQLQLEECAMTSTLRKQHKEENCRQ